MNQKTTYDVFYVSHGLPGLALARAMFFSAEVPGGVGKLQMLNTNDQVDEAIPGRDADA